MAASSLVQVAALSSCPLRATAGTAISTTPAPTATTGRPRSTRATPTVHAASTSTVAAPTATTGAASAVYPFALSQNNCASESKAKLA